MAGSPSTLMYYCDYQFDYFSITSSAANLQNISFVCMLFQLIVIVNNA